MIVVVFVLFFALVAAWLLAPRPEAEQASVPAPSAPAPSLSFAETPA